MQVRAQDRHIAGRVPAVFLLLSPSTEELRGTHHSVDQGQVMTQVAQLGKPVGRRSNHDTGHQMLGEARHRDVDSGKEEEEECGNWHLPVLWKAFPLL